MRRDRPERCTGWPQRRVRAIVAGCLGLALCLLAVAPDGLAQSTCSYTISPSSRTHGSGAESGSVSVTVGSNCNWTSSSSAAWAAITSGLSGAGNGTVTYTLTPNSTPASRTAVLSIAGASFSITQATRCTYGLSQTSSSHGAGAESGNVTVSAPEGCAWTAAANASWITVTSGSSGEGNGVVEYSVAPNTTASARNGSIFIGGKTLAVTQATLCNFTLAPTIRSHGPGAELGSIAVTVAEGCSWTAAANASWIIVTSGSSGTGNGTVSYSVAANGTSLGRSASVVVGGKTFSITQATACPYTLTPASRSHGPGAESATVSVAVPGGCSWTAASNVPWVAITGGSSGSGNGTVSYSLSANYTPAARSGTLSIADRSFSISQATNCVYALSPSSRVHEARDGEGSFSISVLDECIWMATSNASWITLASPTSGKGAGGIAYKVAENRGNLTRTGTVTVSGKTYRVDQLGVGCPYTYRPTSRSHTADAQGAGFAIEMQGDCPYRVTSGASWVTLDSGNAYSGSAVVAYSLAANLTTASRSSTINIASQVDFNVSQATPCPSFLIFPTSRAHSPEAETGVVEARNATVCEWPVSTSANWITVTSGKSGSGDGAVTYTITPNRTPLNRSASISIGGKSYNINQATSCPVSISPGTRSHSADAELGTVFVTTPDGCEWTATSTSSWISISAGASAKGNGVVEYVVSANNGASRSGSITIGDKSFSISQATNCPYTVSPVSRAHGSGAESGVFFIQVREGCPWTAASTVSWLQLSSASSGDGDGAVGYTLAPNATSATRSGTVKIGALSFSVTQATGDADLALSISHHGNFTIGSRKSYLVTVENVGSKSTTGSVVLTDTLPPGLSFVSGSGGGWTCSSADRIVTCTSEDPVAGGSRSTMLLTVAVDIRAVGTVMNTASISNAGDRNSANNSAIDATLITEPGVLPYDLAERGAVSAVGDGGEGPPAVGYARIIPDAAQRAPAGLAIFSSRLNGVWISETSVPAVSPIQSGRIFAEVNDDVNTGIAIANPNAQPATLSFHFTASDGTDFGAGTATIPGNAQTAVFLNQSPFNGGPSLVGTFTFRADRPISIVALRVFINERRESLLTAVPVSPLVGGRDAPVLPHFAEGGGWRTQLVLTNSTDQTISGTIQFLGQGSGGNPAVPVAVNIDGLNTTETRYSIPPRSTRRLRTSGSAAPAVSGSIRVVPAADGTAPAALAILSYNSAGVTVTETAVSAQPAGSAFQSYVEALGTEPVQSGFAIANLGASPAAVAFDLTTLAGAPTGVSGTLVVPGKGQIAQFLNQLSGFERLPLPFRGVLRLSTGSVSKIGVIGLRSRINQRGDFLITTTPSVNDEEPGTIQDLMLPHFVTGAGYTTQFIVQDRRGGQGSKGVVQFFDPTGTPLDLSTQ